MVTNPARFLLARPTGCGDHGDAHPTRVGKWAHLTREGASTTTQHRAALTLDGLAAAQGVAPVRDADELAVDGLWASDLELSAFLRDLAQARLSGAA